MPSPSLFTSLPVGRGEGGVSLIELLVVLAIIGILSMIAIPSFRSFIADQRVRVATSDIVGEVALARAEAMKRDAAVVLAPLSLANGWGAGWRIFADADSDGAFDAGEEVIKVTPGLSGSIRSCSNVVEFVDSIRFRPDGRVLRTSVVGSIDGITVSDDLGDADINNDKIRTVVFGLTGRTSVEVQNGQTNGGVPCP